MEDNWQLKPETLLKEGQYRIIRPLEQDDTGIIYEAEQVPEHRRVYVREFFLSDFCNRFFSTSKMSVIPGKDSVAVNEGLAKFIREGRQKQGRGDYLDVFEDNWTAYYILKHFSGRARPVAEKVPSEPLPAPASVRKEPEPKPSEVPAAGEARLPEEKKAIEKPVERKPAAKKPADSKGPRKLVRYGLMSVLSLGLLALLFFLIRPGRTGEDVVVEESAEWTVPDEPQEIPAKVEEPDMLITEKDKQQYHGLVDSCWDAIGAWGDFKGTVPTDALALLKEIKKQEKDYGPYSEEFNESPGLADELLGKIVIAQKRWEKAGDDQRSISKDRARSCYQLALDLAQSIVTIKKEVLEKETEDQPLQDDIRRIRNKINELK